jgi:hypothetical protein
MLFTRKSKRPIIFFQTNSLIKFKSHRNFIDALSENLCNIWFTTTNFNYRRPMPSHQLTDFLLLPKLKLTNFEQVTHRQALFHCKVRGNSAFCPSCGMETSKVHDRRKVNVKDAPHGNKENFLIITKRRFRCEGMGCKKVFTEQVDGINNLVDP